MFMKDPVKCLLIFIDLYRLLQQNFKMNPERVDLNNLQKLLR